MCRREGALLLNLPLLLALQRLLMHRRLAWLLTLPPWLCYRWLPVHLLLALPLLLLRLVLCRRLLGLLVSLPWWWFMFGQLLLRGT